ncbi:hypothetical protein FA95DRAFT_1560771 [Auriscalpium vulgare]|uniref:Uncharacterized protein n=1 Tax=Auriscalpium vulgare TaxID=40419 RepID=A0ACB8RPF9_9AGAM|nr:hypothetical protein FA95DRAFT_1560771 [Auriscalpium vulgare]
MLLDLPEDLLHAIILLVDDTKSILACLATCRRLNTLGDSLRVQYSIELGASGMREGPDARHLDVSEKLQRLRAYRSACARDITLELLPFAPFVAGNIGSRLHSSVTTLVSETDSDDEHRGTVLVQQMPSVLRGIEERHWSIELPGHMHKGVSAVDASQDLLVAYASDYSVNDTWILHMLSLSTGEPHPSAFCASKEVTRSHLVDEVLGDYCAAKGWEEARRCVTIWNWKTQSREVKLFLPQPEPDFSFTFLDAAHIVILATDPSVILVYSFDVEQSEYLPTTFALPTDSRITNILELNNCTTVAGSDHPGIFHPTPSRMLSVFFNTPRDPCWFYLNIPTDTLLAPLQAAPATMQWADWGPAGSRLIPLPENVKAGEFDPRGVMCAVTLAQDESIWEAESTAVLADFRPSRVAQARRRGVGFIEEAYPATSEGVGGLVKARLPYAAKKFTWPSPWKEYNVLMCEDQMFVIEDTDPMTPGEGGRVYPKAWVCTI